MNTYKTKEHESLNKAAMAELLGALNASPLALRRDDCGAWYIKGRLGHIYTMGPIADENGFLIVLMCDSARQWSADKKRLTFCCVTQDGDCEGCLTLGTLPTPHQAAAIRKVLGISKRRPPSKISDQFAAHIEGFATEDGQDLGDSTERTAWEIDEVFSPETTTLD
jgi:hypothetical protein